MTETYFHTPWLWAIVRSLSAVPVGDLARWWSIEDVNIAFSAMIGALDKKRNLLLYPSWHIYVQWFEHIIWKKMAYELMSRVDSSQRIILTRTRWLWWSIWSKAYTWTSPEIFSVLIQSIWIIIANAIFFVPKRQITIEFIDMTTDLHLWHKQWIDIFNKNLENFYNQLWTEECHFIKHYFYYNDILWKTEPESIEWSVQALEKWSWILRSDISLEIYNAVMKIVSDVKSIDPNTLEFSTNLILDIHADSLDMAEIKSRVQVEYPSASNPPIGSLITIWDVMAMASWQFIWLNILPDVSFSIPKKYKIDYCYTQWDTISSLIVKNLNSLSDEIFMYDAITWSMDRKTFLLRAYVVWEYLKSLKTTNLGIMMPALASTSILLTWAYLGSKFPVMLNWTVWEKSFAHCMDFAGLDTILTSKKFYQKIQTPWLKNYESKMIFVEDIIQNISYPMKLKAIIQKSLHMIPKYTDDAVMLFTSGSESLPKAVKLTHKNILTDIEGALKLVDFYSGEVFMWILPPFHSFGFTINTICPLIFPLRAVYSPDPSDSKTVVDIIAHTKATILAGTPTFLRMILGAWTSESLHSLNMAIAWAEKCTQETFDLFAQKCPHAVLIEWYWITECSPIVTVNPTSHQKQGSAGKFIPSLEYTIRRLDNSGSTLAWEQGMLYVSGSSIFTGYMDNSIDSPFEEWDNKIWYKTGDLGYIDNDGYLFITWRLKRFVKIAGEMVSLPFIESILLEKYGNPEYPALAIEASENEGETVIVAFATKTLSLEELNEYIHNHGASNIIKIHRVHQIDAIPILGTGKTDYKQLKSMI